MYFRETGFEDRKWIELAQFCVAYIDIEPPGSTIPLFVQFIRA